MGTIALKERNCSLWEQILFFNTRPYFRSDTREKKNNISSMRYITKTYLYNIDPLKPHFYNVYSKIQVYMGIHYFSYFCSET